MIKISTEDLIPLNAFENEYPVEIDVIYAQENHPDNHFKKLYHPEAKILWAHKDLAAVILIAAFICEKLYGWRLQINDCLRPVEAQEKMAEYGYDPSLVSLPGNGAHPRAMAVDIQPVDSTTGKYINMGTPFDFFSDDPAADNPAARDYTKFDLPLKQIDEILTNRSRLEYAMRLAATRIGREILPLPQEWWDFRFYKADFAQFAPLSEDDLEPCQRLINPDLLAVKDILLGVYSESMEQCLEEIRQVVEDQAQKL